MTWQAGWQSWEALPGIALDVFCCHGAAPGPLALITAGVHGDEYEGPAAVTKFSRQLNPAMLRGTVLLVPVVNPPAYLAGTRLNPDDGRNLARCFPGNENGSPTERLAAAVFSRLAAPADYLIDLHSGGVEYSFLPLAGFYGPAESGNSSYDAARHFGLPYLWQLPPTPGVLSYEVFQRGKVAIGNEYCGAGQLSPAGVQQYTNGILACLTHWGLWDAPLPPLSPQHRLFGDWLLASSTGLLRSRCTLGQSVKAGELLGVITSPRGEILTGLPAPRTGIVAAIRSKAYLRQGDWAVLVAEARHV